MSSPNRGYILPAPLTGYETVCLQMQIPDNVLYRAAIVGAITTLTQWWNWEKTGDNSGSIAAQYWRQLVLDTLIIDGCKPDDLPPLDGGEGSMAAAIDNLLELMEELNVKYRLNGQLYEPVIDLVPCGCGDGDTEPDGTTPPTSVPGSSGGGDYGNFTTLCDALSVLPAYIIDAVDDFLGRIDSGLFVVTVDQDEFVPIINSIVDSIQEIQDELLDPDFRVILENNIVKSFNDPWTPLTREDLRQFAYRFPAVFDGAPMWAAFVLWANFANLNALNKAVLDGKGAGDSALCAVVFNRTGRTQFQQTDPNTTTLEYQLVNDSGFPGLKLFLSTTAISEENDAGFTEITSFGTCFLDGWTVKGAGVHLSQNTGIQTTGLFSKGVLDGGSRIIQSQGSSFGGNELGAVTGDLTTATINEVANVIQAAAGYFPVFPAGGTPTTNFTALATDCRSMWVLIGANGSGIRAETDCQWVLAVPPP